MPIRRINSPEILTRGELAWNPEELENYMNQLSLSSYLPLSFASSFPFAQMYYKSITNAIITKETKNQPLNPLLTLRENGPTGLVKNNESHLSSENGFAPFQSFVCMHRK